MNLFVIGAAATGKELETVLTKINVRIESSDDPAAVEARLRKGFSGLAVFDEDHFAAHAARKNLFYRLLKKHAVPFIVLSSQKDTAVILDAQKQGACDYILRPYNQREFIMRYHAAVRKKVRLACLGGGTGLFTLLLGLKTLPETLLVSVVNMSDDGGSSGKLSQTFGILPPGDIRRSLVALSNAPELMNQIIQHRFDKGGELHGHSFGNIFLTVLAEVKGSMSEAVKALSDILNIQGIVLPATLTLTTLVAQFQNGKVIKGESRIDLGSGRDPDVAIKDLWHEPEPECDAEAFASLVFADLIVIGPGDLYTSVITNLALDDIRDAILKSRAKKLYVCNLMTKPGETSGFDAAAHVQEIVKYLGKDCLDYVLISDSKLSDESIAEYAKKNQMPVVVGPLARLRRLTKARLIVADIGNETELVRHDSMKLKEEIRKIIKPLFRKRVS